MGGIENYGVYIKAASLLNEINSQLLCSFG
jgi:hypothetical protein